MGLEWGLEWGLKCLDWVWNGFGMDMRIEVCIVEGDSWRF